MLVMQVAFKINIPLAIYILLSVTKSPHELIGDQKCWSVLV